MHDNGTAKQADDRISTPGISQAVRGNSDLPARAWRAASTERSPLDHRLHNQVPIRGCHNRRTVDPHTFFRKVDR